MAAAHTVTPQMDEVHPACRLREQRRYEIARDVLAAFAAMNKSALDELFNGYGECAEFAVKWADALLDELEK